MTRMIPTLAVLAMIMLAAHRAHTQETQPQPEKTHRIELKASKAQDETALVERTAERNLEAEVASLREALQQALQRIAALEAAQNKVAHDGNKNDTAKKAERSIEVSGYIQGQYLRESGEGDNVSRFDVRRGRFKVEAALSPLASLTLQTEATDADVELKDAYIDLNLRNGQDAKVRLGQFKVPLSFQILESSSRRLTPERALINLRSVPGERDRGLVFDVPLQPDSKTSPLLQVGAFNGRGINQKPGNGQTTMNYIAALHFPSKPISGRVAFLGGRFTNDAANRARVTKSRFMADVQYERAPWNVQLQYGMGTGDFPKAGGTVSHTDVRGGYFQVAHIPRGSRFTFLVRYQTYDPDTDTGGNTISGPLFGLVYDASDRVRYMVALERLDDDAKSGKLSIITVRTQVKY